jgi:hypothetical protein
MHYIATVAVVELHMDNFRGLTNERHRPAVLRHMLIENALSDAVRGFSTHRLAARWNAMHLRLSG